VIGRSQTPHFSQEGTTAISLSPLSVKVKHLPKSEEAEFSADLHTEPLTAFAHDAEIRDLAFAADSTTIFASASNDRYASIWEIQDHQIVQLHRLGHK
jgi:WD40 repeat protein